MDLRDEIARQVDKLPADEQDQVLRFVTALAAASQNVSGARLARFAFTLDPESAQQITQAIEEGCERVDANEW